MKNQNIGEIERYEINEQWSHLCIRRNEFDHKKTKAHYYLTGTFYSHEFFRDHITWDFFLDASFCSVGW